MAQYGTLVLVTPVHRHQEFELAKTEVTLGRGPANDILLEDDQASREHARLLCGPASCLLEDRGSANGVFLNGRRIRQAALNEGDRLTVGETTFAFRRPRATEDLGPDDIAVLDTEQAVETALHRATVMARITETRQTRLIVTTSARTFEIPLGTADLSLGRLPDNDITLPSAAVSRRHARIECIQGGYVLRDLDTANGTWVRGARIARHHLQDMDTIRIGDAHLLFELGYSGHDLTLLAPVHTERPRRPVVLIPGFLGSTLWLGEEKIWPNLRAMGRLPDLLKWEVDRASSLVPRGLIDQVVIVPNVVRQEQYGGLIAYLEETLGYRTGEDLFAFAYDFRQDLRITARQLGEAIEGWRCHGPVTLIAHSMGSLISRYYVNRLGGHRHVERMVLLGGPHGGSPKAVMNLAVPSNLLPFGVLGARIQDIVQTFPSIYSLLPETPCGEDQHGRAIDWLHDESWLTPALRPLLRNAAEFREEIRGVAKVRTLCVFGYGLKTLTSLRVQREPGGLCSRLEGIYEAAGDGTVPEASAVIPGADIHPIQQYHGTLHIDSDLKKRLKVELAG